MPSTRSALIHELTTIRASFRQLASCFGKIAPLLSAAPGTSSANGTGPAEVRRNRKRRTLTPARRKALKLQGRYIGTIRMLSAGKKAKVKRIRDAKGVRAAIAYARKLAS